MENAARQAYEVSDVERSRRYHDDTRQRCIGNGHGHGHSEDDHQSEGGKLKQVIFGGLDGILTSFAIVAGSAGGKLDPSVILILGFSNIFADALAMGVGEFLSSKAENEWILNEKRREEWEFENYPTGEIDEMIDIYLDKGVNKDDATLIINTMAKYRELFIDVMMTQELELQVPEIDHVQQSFKEGIIMFCSFAFFGALPLLGYVIIPIIQPGLHPETLFTSACIITGIVLFFMGCLKSFFSHHHWLCTGFETVFLGGTCACVAYTIGQFVEHITDVHASK